MKIVQHHFEVATAGPGLYGITTPIVSWVERQGIERGLLTVFLPHTSASLLIQENADPDVHTDLRQFFDRLVPEDAQRYRHSTEGGTTCRPISRPL